jgi:tetratricopeptide (TPR) repeat protein
MNDFKIDFIKTLLSLVEEYSEKDKDKIDKSAPCVYKSLMLLLEDISFPDFGEELIKDDNLVMKIGEYIDQFYFIYYPDLLKYSNNDFGLSDADEAYYDAMDFLLAGDWKKAEIILDDAFLDHSDSIQIYVGLAAVYRYSDNFENWRLIIEMGYDELLKQFPKWPNEMSWGKITNRQYLRMIELKALLLYKQNKIEGAKKLYKLLIKLNPYDNQGIRYCLAGIYEGLSADDIEEMLGNEDGKIDPVKIKKIEELFEKQNKIHNFFNIEDEDDDYDDDISETDFTDENKAAFKWIIK